MGLDLQPIKTVETKSSAFFLMENVGFAVISSFRGKKSLILGVPFSLQGCYISVNKLLSAGRRGVKEWRKLKILPWVKKPKIGFGENYMISVIYF